MRQGSSETIGQYRESSLHAELKSLYAGDGAVCEAPLGGFYVDVLRSDMIVEVQTSSFGAIRRKAEALAGGRRFRLVHPVAARKTIATHAETGERLRLKTSPKKGGYFDLFEHLVNAATLPLLPGFELELLLVAVEETRVEDGRGSWRRKGISILDKRLVAVLESRLFRTPADYLALLPPALGPEFTSTELAEAAGIRRPLAMKACYCLRAMGALEERGKRGRNKLYARAKAKKGAKMPAAKVPAAKVPAAKVPAAKKPAAKTPAVKLTAARPKSARDKTGASKVREAKTGPAKVAEGKGGAAGAKGAERKPRPAGMIAARSGGAQGKVPEVAKKRSRA